MAKQSTAAESRSRSKLEAIQEPSPVESLRRTIVAMESRQRELESRISALFRENRALKAEADRQEQQSRQLHEVAADLLRASTVKAVGEALTERCLDAFGCRGVAMFLAAPERRHLKLIAMCGYTGDAGPGGSELQIVRELLAKRVVRTDGAVYMQSHADWRSAIADESRRQQFEIQGKSAAALPMLTPAMKAFGVIILSFDRWQRFPQEIRRHLQLIAALAADAVQRARNYDQAVLACARAEQANRRKDEFFAVLSHELRTPIVPIVGWASMLSTPGGVTPERLKIALDSIGRNAKNLSYLIEDLLDTVRISSGKLSLQLEDICIQDVAQEALQVVQHTAQEKKIVVESHIDVSIPPLTGDPRRLRQVFWNLLTNAVKFTSPQGRVEFTIQRVDGCVRCVVTDDGEGISPDFLPHVFDRFRQEPADQKRPVGLGLGLSIVRHIVGLHGGTVRASSSGRGKGSTFQVELPLKNR